MIKFTKLTYKNFLAVGAAPITVYLDKSSMTLVVGKNGAGKSSSIDALTYGLYGTAFRNVNNNELINATNGRELLVELEFEKGPNKYRIVRGQKPTIFEIYENGIKINQDSSSKDYQKYLERSVLGFNKKTFSQVVVIGSSAYVPFMRLTPKDRRVVIENLLDIEVFGVMTQITKHLNKMLYESLDKKSEQVNTAIEKINLHKKHIENARETTKEAKANKQIEIDAIEASIEKSKVEKTKAETEIAALLVSIADHKDVSRKFKEINSMEIKIRQNWQRAKEELEFFTEKDDCPTCKQHISNKEEMVDKCEKHVNKYETGLKEIQEKQEKLEARLNQISKDSDRIAELRGDVSLLSANINYGTKNIAALREEIKSLTVKKAIGNASKISEELVLELENLNLEKKNMLKKRNYFEMIEILLKDSGIKAKIIKQYLPVINSNINKYLQVLGLPCEMTLDETFDETIHYRGRDIRAYEGLSEGQKRRVDLALLFAWRSVAKAKGNCHTNVLILDEVLDGSLDADGLTSFMEMLRLFKNDKQNVYIISHRSDVLIDKFENVLQFKLDGLFTSLVDE